MATRTRRKTTRRRTPARGPGGQFKKKTRRRKASTRKPTTRRRRRSTPTRRSTTVARRKTTTRRRRRSSTRRAGGFVNTDVLIAGGSFAAGLFVADLAVRQIPIGFVQTPNGQIATKIVLGLGVAAFGRKLIGTKAATALGTGMVGAGMTQLAARFVGGPSGVSGLGSMASSPAIIDAPSVVDLMPDEQPQLAGLAGFGSFAGLGDASGDFRREMDEHMNLSLDAAGDPPMAG